MLCSALNSLTTLVTCNCSAQTTQAGVLPCAQRAMVYRTPICVGWGGGWEWPRISWPSHPSHHCTPSPLCIAHREVKSASQLVCSRAYYQSRPAAWTTWWSSSATRGTSSVPSPSCPVPSSFWFFCTCSPSLTVSYEVGKIIILGFNPFCDYRFRKICSYKHVFNVFC